MHRIRKRGAQYWKENAEIIQEGAKVGAFMVRINQDFLLIVFDRDF